MYCISQTRSINMGKMEEAPTWQNGKHYGDNGPHKRWNKS
jgi:hypothetical protein